MKGLFFVFAAFSLMSSAASASMVYTGRCNISTPPIKISLDSDPRTQIDCKMENGSSYLFLKNDVHVSVGSENYLLTGEWNTYKRDCQSAIGEFKESSWFPSVDPESGAKITLIMNADRIDIALRTPANTELGCTGKIAGGN